MADQAINLNWRTYRFDEISTKVNERVEPGETDLAHYVGLEHLDGESLKIRRWGSPSDVIGQKLGFRKGDIIFGKRRVYQRKLAVADFDGICSAHAIVLRPKTDVVLPEFLPFFMQSDLFMNRALEISVGSLSPTINWKTLARQEFALPPLAEQRRIAEVLKANEAVAEALAKLSAVMDILADAVIEDFLGSKIATDDALLGTRADVRYGLTVNRTRREALQRVPYLRVANVLRGRLDLSEVKDIGHLNGDEQYVLQANDVLIVEGHANPEEIGRAALWNNAIARCSHQNHLIRVRCEAGLDPEFLTIYLNSTLGKRHFRSHSKSTSGLNTINSKVVRETPIPDISPDLQQSIVKSVNEIRTGIDMIQQRQASTLLLKGRLLTQAHQ